MPKTAVVILNYNGRNFLEQFLPTVIQLSTPHEVIVADNASTDSSIPYLKENFPSLRLIELNDNTGYAGGYNQALAQIEADYYVLLNSDVEVTPNWIDPVIALMEQDEKTVACQPKVRSYHQREYFEYAGAAGGYMDYLGYPFCRGRIFGTLEKDEGQYDDSRPIFWATGACLFVKADAFHQLGGFDSDYFAHMEEIDWCWRALNQGFNVMYCAESTVYHVGGGTLKTESPFKTYLNFRNNLLTLYKNTPKTAFRKIILKRVLLDKLAFIQLIVQGKIKNAWAILRAWKDFFSLKKKKVPVKSTKNPLIFKKSVVRIYFLKGLKKFSAIERY